MIHACMGQLYGADSRCIYGFRNKGVDIIKLRVADLQIDASQGVDPVGHRRPAEGHIVVDLKVQVFLQGLDRLFMASLGIGLIDLVILALIVDLQVGIPVNGNQLDLPGLPVDIRHHDDVRIGPPFQLAFPGVHSEHRHGPVLPCHQVFHKEKARHKHKHRQQDLQRFMR